MRATFSLMLNLVSIIVGLVAAVCAVVAFIPLLGWANWLIVPLALIGAVVAEFFGTPIVGMGFRINAEVGRMNIDTVWATIAVAAVSGSLLYGLVALAERRATFWHPSFRGRRS